MTGTDKQIQDTPKALHIIGTKADGAVVCVLRCPNGIDEALPIIASLLSDPEEDVAATMDILIGQWQEICDEWDRYEEPYKRTVFDRGYSVRYGLAVI